MRNNIFDSSSLWGNLKMSGLCTNQDVLGKTTVPKVAKNLILLQ